MKKQKLNFESIMKVLNRDEMKKIMAGSGSDGGCNDTGGDCSDGAPYIECCHGCFPIDPYPGGRRICQ